MTRLTSAQHIVSLSVYVPSFTQALIAKQYMHRREAWLSSTIKQTVVYNRTHTYQGRRTWSGKSGHGLTSFGNSILKNSYCYTELKNAISSFQSLFTYQSFFILNGSSYVIWPLWILWLPEIFTGLLCGANMTSTTAVSCSVATYFNIGIFAKCWWED